MIVLRFGTTFPLSPGQRYRQPSSSSRNVVTAYLLPNGSDGVLSSAPSSTRALPTVRIRIPPGPNPLLLAPSLFASSPSPTRINVSAGSLAEPGSIRPLATFTFFSSLSLSTFSCAPDICDKWSRRIFAPSPAARDASDGTTIAAFA
ncbi:hypothetical protein ES703_120361 [subsurface metagenome]